jgi:hypothetical protein
MLDIALPEMFKIQSGGARILTGAEVWPLALRYVDVANSHLCYVVASITIAAAATTITIEQAKTRIGGSTKAITVAVPIWHNAACEATDTLVRQTAAVFFTTAATAHPTLTVFQIDPATLDLANGFTFIIAKTSVAAAAYASVEFFLTTRYPQATPPAQWTA